LLGPSMGLALRARSARARSFQTIGSRPVQSTALPSLPILSQHMGRAPAAHGCRFCSAHPWASPFGLAPLAPDRSRRSGQDRCNQPLCHPSPFSRSMWAARLRRMAAGFARPIHGPRPPGSLRSRVPDDRVKIGAIDRCRTPQANRPQRRE
jgi:hypothetical protein